MKVCIVGAGAIGGVLGAKLAAAGHEVSLVARGEHLAAIRAKGLALKDAEGTRTFRLAAAETEMSHAGEFDYVIINNEFEDARRDLAAVVRASRLTLERQSARHPELFRLHN